MMSHAIVMTPLSAHVRPAIRAATPATTPVTTLAPAPAPACEHAASPIAIQSVPGDPISATVQFDCLRFALIASVGY